MLQQYLEKTAKLTEEQKELRRKAHATSQAVAMLGLTGTGMLRGVSVSPTTAFGTSLLGAYLTEEALRKKIKEKGDKMPAAVTHGFLTSLAAALGVVPGVGVTGGLIPMLKDPKARLAAGLLGAGVGAAGAYGAAKLTAAKISEPLAEKWRKARKKVGKD